MAKIQKRPVAPIYTIAVVWVLFTLLHSLYAASDFVYVILLSAVAFIIAKGIWPTVTYEIPDVIVPEEAKQAEPEQPKEPEDPKISALIEEKNRALSEMRRLNDAIPDAKLTQQIDELEELTGKIVDHVAAHPEKLPQIRKFMNYYLPTTLKILNTYDRMGAVGPAGENTEGTMQKIETMMDTIVDSFRKQLDSLFRDEAMDISSEITVMETMLAREGVGGTQIPGV